MLTHKISFILIILVFYIQSAFTNLMEKENSTFFKTLNRQKRKLPLIFHDFGVSQFVCGFGVPLDDTDYESVTSGIVFKSELPLPSNVKDLRNHTTHNVNGGRVMDYGQNLRWEFYKMLEIWADSMGLNGRACVLKTLYEASQIPINNETGDLWHDIFHILFSPFSSVDTLHHHTNNEYLAAANIGINTNTDCGHIFKECPKSILNIFTNVF